MDSIKLTPTWKAAARIFIACLVNGDSAEARDGAEREIMEMADKLDKLSEARDSFDNPENDSWFVQFAGGEYEIVYCENRPRLSPSWAVVRLNDMAESERYYSWPNGAFTALSSGAINWRK